MGLLPRLYTYILHRIFWSQALEQIRENHKEMCFREGLDEKTYSSLSVSNKTKSKNSKTHNADRPYAVLPSPNKNSE